MNPAWGAKAVPHERKKKKKKKKKGSFGGHMSNVFVVGPDGSDAASWAVTCRWHLDRTGAGKLTELCLGALFQL